jgi:hypothetical protein
MMGDNASNAKIAMGDNSGGATVDAGTAAQLWWLLPWTVVAAIGDNNGSSIVMGNGSCRAMDGVTSAQ